MSQSLAQIYLHITYSTAGRRPFLRDGRLREETHGYLVGVCRKQESPSLVVGGPEDHVHVLCRLSRRLSVADLVRELKRDSSKWIKNQSASPRDFHWQGGYGAFSISPSHVDALREYIATQMEHHRHESFQDEFRRFCKKYEVEIDERYVWD